MLPINTCYAMQLVDALGATEFLPSRQSSSDAFAQLCAAVPSACVDVLDAICGADDENFNLTRLPEYFVNTPAGERLLDSDLAGVLSSATPPSRRHVLPSATLCW